VRAIFREALSNIARHAQATRADIEFDVGEIIVLRISDDGIGIDPHCIHEGRGLRNMATRAEVLGGTLLVRPGANGGTRVECILPLPES
jgi:signal transduction histidine kinase